MLVHLKLQTCYNLRYNLHVIIYVTGAMEIDCALTCHRVFAAAKVRRQELRDTREEWEEREEAALLQDMQMCLTKVVDTRSATSLSSFV